MATALDVMMVGCVGVGRREQRRWPHLVGGHLCQAKVFDGDGLDRCWLKVGTAVVIYDGLDCIPTMMLAGYNESFWSGDNLSSDDMWRTVE